VPTYQYACTECAERLEVVQRFSDDPLTVCSACGGRLRKVFSPVGIVFKGSGFYRTDSRKGGSEPAVASANGKTGESSSGSDSGSSSAGAGDKGDKKAPGSSDSSSSPGSSVNSSASSGSGPASSSGSKVA
jgi:putative FmdB family regulatory protein